MDRKSGIKNVLVIFGGCSPEYGVSLQSAAAVIRNIDRDKYMPVLVGITKAGDWYYYDGDVQNIENGGMRAVGGRSYHRTGAGMSLLS